MCASGLFVLVTLTCSLTWLCCRAVPVLGGRTGSQVYSEFMQSFREEFGPWLGNNIADVLIGEVFALPIA